MKITPTTFAHGKYFFRKAHRSYEVNTVTCLWCKQITLLREDHRFYKVDASLVHGISRLHSSKKIKDNTKLSLSLAHVISRL